MKFQAIDESTIEYKNFTLLQKFVTDRGKLIPARVSGVSVKGQRKIAESVKIARYLALLSAGGVK
jgi:small subunit ribosomal protein S18